MSEAWAPPSRRVKLSPAKAKLVRSALDDLVHFGDKGVQSASEPLREQQQQQQVRRNATPKRPPLPQLLKGGGPMARERAELPVYRSRSAILDALRKPVSLVEGQTGCGKSTQVAQYLLEDAARTKQPISIAFTQPRRISAVGVAERIAAERGERIGHGAVGYAVRGESRQSARGNALLVCTVGVLLRILEEDPSLARFDVVLVDEVHLIASDCIRVLLSASDCLLRQVHERSVENDLLLLALRRVLLRQRRQTEEAARRSRRAANRTNAAKNATGTPTGTAPLPRLRLCLMSATLASDYFEAYFGQQLRLPVPRVRLQGRAYEVTTRYLEHALAETDHRVIPSAPWCIHSAAARRRAAQSDNPERVALMPQAKVAERFPTASPAVLDALRALDLTAINVDLILQLVRRFVSSKEAEGGGGVLVFLPGSGEIDEVMRVLIGVLASPDGPVRAEWVIPLHGALPPHEQVRVFQPAPAGVTKLVLATNVAETSITINDIALVIDTGRVKRVRYDASTRMTRLDDVCISDAEARQRRGRAGRVRAGLCYHLFPSDAVLVPATEPEVFRVH